MYRLVFVRNIHSIICIIFHYQNNKVRELLSKCHFIRSIYLCLCILLLWHICTNNPDSGDRCTAARLLFDATDAGGGLSDSNAVLSTKSVCRPVWSLWDSDILPNSEGTCWVLLALGFWKWLVFSKLCSDCQASNSLAHTYKYTWALVQL